jgi:hypothetical protein
MPAANRLILACDGEQARLEPKALGRTGRFISGYAPWPCC